MIAFDAIYALLKNRLPRVNVVGYDCVAQEVHIPYDLYSIGADKRALAERAAEIIVERVERNAAPRCAESVGVSGYDGGSAI